ncbi:hypothetical protein GF361_05085 [Candidatus Woesearchaeota archaeon]|nr:hypothetical protein [Candidatus Woesearchaeota archaeon]
MAGSIILYNRKLSKKRTDLIVEKVREKKDLVNLGEDFIIAHLVKFLEQNTAVLDYLVEAEIKDIKRSSKFKKIVKHIRGKARKIYGIFQTTAVSKRKEYLAKYIKTKKEKDLIRILKTHRSTKERILYNKELYEKIFSLTLKPRSIFDIGAGLNPLSFRYMGLEKDVRYIASEFNKKDVDFLNLFFRKTKMKNSNAVRIDLLVNEERERLKSYKTDICFLFKVLDSLEEFQENISYDVISLIRSKFIVVSFPLYSITGRRMRLQRRNWFEKLGKRLDFKIDFFKMKNELFYILRK